MAQHVRCSRAMRTAMLTVLLMMTWVPAPALADEADEAQTTPVPTASPPLPPPPPPVRVTVTPAPYPYYDYPPPPRLPERPRRAWYGWQTLTTDAMAMAMVLGASESRDGKEIAYLGLATYTFGGPIVHLAHGNPGRAAGSLALRSLPGVLILTEPRSPSFGMLALLSIPAAIAIDAAVLAREDEEPARPRFGPTAAITQHGGLVRLNGTF